MLTNVIQKFLEKKKLELKYYRGQRHDTAVDVKGKNSDVQKKILDENPMAFFLPRWCHILNLVLRDAAKSSVKSVTFFAVFGRLCSLFDASVNRWKTLTDHVRSFTLKRLRDSVKALEHQTVDAHRHLPLLLREKKDTILTLLTKLLLFLSS
jgi:hypothetical protein